MLPGSLRAGRCLPKRGTKGGAALTAQIKGVEDQHCLSDRDSVPCEDVQQQQVSVRGQSRAGLSHPQPGAAQAGEHAHCGRGVLAGGFSYEAAAFAAAGVEMAVCGWRDMGVPTLLRMLEVVQVHPLSPHSSPSLVARPPPAQDHRRARCACCLPC